MKKGTGKGIAIIVVIAVVLFALVFVGIKATEDVGKTKDQVSSEDSAAKLSKLYGKIHVATAQPIKGQIDLDPVDVGAALPEIDKFPVTVPNSTDSFVEIFSSTEKSGKDNDGWLNIVAADFNRASIQVNGKAVSVKIRNLASGTAADYIKSGKYVPDAFTPSNELWGEMVKNDGVVIQTVSKRLVGNVPGIVISKAHHKKMIEDYGAVNIKTVTEAIANNEFAMGYTDPFTSSTGLNFLVAALATFDNKDILSDTAAQGFAKFQANVPFTASTTSQMRDAALSGKLDGFVLEYQQFANTPSLRNDYVFTPFGVRHDNPLYAIGSLPTEKAEILNAFADFTAQEKYQQLANEMGFNNMDDYQSEMPPIDGTLLGNAQKFWKEKKNGIKPIAAVFVTDVSGSMDGEPLNRLKESLIKGQKYLGADNSIGLVSYSSNVTINVPIGKYDTNHQSEFVGAVNSLQAEGGTATFDGIVVAMKMLQEELAVNPSVKPVIFVLSDGETNEGFSLKDIKGLVATYHIPIYTIGYNADIAALQSISNINEAASINADTEDVVYKIGNLFNAQM